MRENFVQRYPPIATIIPVNNPTANNRPIGASIISAAAIGPGVGGTNTCAENNPVAKQIDRRINLYPVFLLTSFITDESNIKAASQKTGIEIIKPIIFNEIGEFLAPSISTNTFTIFFVLPVFSRNTPRIDPASIRGPIPIRIFVKPSTIRLIDLVISKPKPIPAINAEIVNE